jgi:DNA-binding NtrC family response regulator
VDALKDAQIDVHICTSVEEARSTLSSEKVVAGLLHMGEVTDNPPATREVELLVETRPTLRLIAIVGREKMQAPQVLRLLQWGLLYDVHTLPVDTQRLQFALGHIRGLVELEEMATLPTDIDGTSEPYMIGSSPAMLQAFEAIRKIGDAPVLITGESGTGKELAAHAIHERSSYRNGPFIAVNCAALPPTLIESELFGHEKGSFTGAHQRKIGRIEAAATGTVFLDEIGDLPHDVQGHFLRFLQDKTIERLGSNRTIEVDVRVIAATHVDLEKAIEANRFREDLFYRLNVLKIHLPPLRERGEDIELIAAFFLRKFVKELRRLLQGFSYGARTAISTYSWPGNVRELISAVRRAVVMAEGKWITAEDLGLPNVPKQPIQALPTLEEARHEVEEDLIRRALDMHNYNIQRAARSLSISRVTLYRIMEKHGINVGKSRSNLTLRDQPEP